SPPLPAPRATGRRPAQKRHARRAFDGSVDYPNGVNVPSETANRDVKSDNKRIDRQQPHRAAASANPLDKWTRDPPRRQRDQRPNHQRRSDDVRTGVKRMQLQRIDEEEIRRGIEREGGPEDQPELPAIGL